jgi:hypothetical protein
MLYSAPVKSIYLDNKTFLGIFAHSLLAGVLGNV